MIKSILMATAIGGLMISGGLAQSTSLGGIADAPKFIASQSSDQWVFSKFKGADVVGPDEKTIGGVNDLLFDKNGKILGVVVGVGGFLGMGQKNVAIDMSAFQVVPAKDTSAPVTGSSSDPTNIKLKVAWTKDQLQQAPDFQYYKAPSGSASNGTRPTTTGMGQQAPSPMAPSSPAAPAR
jgi:hypothetical protein